MICVRNTCSPDSLAASLLSLLGCALIVNLGTIRAINKDLADARRIKEQTVIIFLFSANEIMCY